jgi:phosphatidylglycerophosphate synthase
VRSREQYLECWSTGHGRVPPHGLVGAWLGLVYPVARPLASVGVPPDLVTTGGLLLALAVPPVAGAGGRWPLAAAALTLSSGLLDGLDGAVAVLSRRESAWGGVLDSCCDRLAEAALAAAWWVAGAPAWLCVAAAGCWWLHEYLRARATASGMVDVGVVSVAERPTRLLTVAAFLLAAGVFPATAAGWSTAGAAVALLVGAVGLTQLATVVRARLTSRPTPAT